LGRAAGGIEPGRRHPTDLDRHAELVLTVADAPRRLHRLPKRLDEGAVIDVGEDGDADNPAVRLRMFDGDERGPGDPVRGPADSPEQGVLPLDALGSELLVSSSHRIEDSLTLEDRLVEDGGSVVHGAPPVDGFL